MKDKPNNRGEVMLESLVVYTITIFLLFFILAIFSALYQRWNVQTISNETAARYAQTYRFSDKDVLSGYVTKDQLVAVKEYRYLGNSLEDSAKKEVLDYSKNRLSKTTFTRDVVEPTISVKVLKDDVSRRHIEVTIEGEYKVPFGEAMDFFGMGGSLKYKTVAYADCVDLIDYVNTTDYIDTQVENNFLDSGLIKAIDSVFSLVAKIDEVINK